MSSLLQSGRILVEYQREYGARLYTIVSPVLDSLSAAIPVRAPVNLSVPGHFDGGGATGIAVQSFLLVMAPDDPSAFPMDVRPWWISTESATIYKGANAVTPVDSSDRINIVLSTP